jgi:phage shock protein A
MTTIISVVIAAVVVLAILNRQALLRMIGAGRAQVGKLGRAVEESDPLSLLNQAVDDGVTSIQQAQRGLEQCASLVRSVQRQVDSGTKEQTRLTSRIKAVMEAGDTNNTARDYAIQLAEVEKQLVINQEQLAKHKESYENFAQQVQIGQKRVLEARRKASGLGVELEMSKREKEMASFAANFRFDPNQLNEGMSRAEELIQQQIDTNRAAGDVARDMSKQSLAEARDDEVERQAQADSILEKFKKV